MIIDECTVSGWYPYPEVEPPMDEHFEAKVKDPVTGKEAVKVLCFFHATKWFYTTGENVGEPCENVVAWGVMGTARREKEGEE